MLLENDIPTYIDDSGKVGGEATFVNGERQE